MRPAGGLTKLVAPTGAVLDWAREHPTGKLGVALSLSKVAPALEPRAGNDKDLPSLRS